MWSWYLRSQKELERNTSKCLDILSAGIKSRAESSSGFSKFRFAAMKSFFIISIEYITSLAPAIHIS